MLTRYHVMLICDCSMYHLPMHISSTYPLFLACVLHCACFLRMLYDCNLCSSANPHRKACTLRLLSFPPTPHNLSDRICIASHRPTKRALSQLAEFMELMEFRYQEKARAHGCFIVSAAGFDSIPADLGVLFTQRQFQSPAVPSAVTSFLSIQSGPAGACGESSTHVTLMHCISAIARCAADCMAGTLHNPPNR